MNKIVPTHKKLIKRIYYLSKSGNFNIEFSCPKARSPGYQVSTARLTEQQPRRPNSAPPHPGMQFPIRKRSDAFSGFSAAQLTAN